MAKKVAIMLHAFKAVIALLWAH